MECEENKYSGSKIGIYFFIFIYDLFKFYFYYYLESLRFFFHIFYQFNIQGGEGRL